MSDIKVLVAGKAGKGKSTVAEVIRQALLNAGIQATLMDDNGIGIVDEPAGTIPNTMTTRLASLSLKTKVEIRTALTQR